MAGYHISLKESDTTLLGKKHARNKNLSCIIRDQVCHNYEYHYHYATDNLHCHKLLHNYIPLHIVS